MPYIQQSRREEITDSSLVETAGELNWLLTILINDYINKHGKSYQTLNEVIGVLECAKLELYRRVVSPYEETKMQQHGDVYK
jgi:hypothetical protein